MRPVENLLRGRGLGENLIAPGPDPILTPYTLHLNFFKDLNFLGRHSKVQSVDESGVMLFEAACTNTNSQFYLFSVLRSFNCGPTF